MKLVGCKLQTLRRINNLKKKERLSELTVMELAKDHSIVKSVILSRTQV